MTPLTLNPTRRKLLDAFGLNVVMQRGKGISLYDADGVQYTDFLSQYGALPFGHNPTEVWAAITAGYDNEIPAMVQPLRPVVAERLADLIAEITPGDLAITTFTNSGAETVEAAIKLARVRTGRTSILSTKNSFHGKTLGALSATGKPMYQKDFGAPVAGFSYVPFGDIVALEEQFDENAEDIAAFIVEPIQGEGGVILPPDGYLDAVISLCRKYGVLSIVDEIQTGMGRTGHMFACEDGQEVPDMLLLSKALGGGVYPIGACVVRPGVWDDRFGSLHSSTFANNNIACLAAEATISQLMRDDRALLRDVANNGKYFHEQLDALKTKYPHVIFQTRGKGFMAGIEFADFGARSSATLAFASLNGGLIPLISSYMLNVHRIVTAPLFNATSVLRLQPPLIATRGDIDRVISALSDVCSKLDQENVCDLVRHLVADQAQDTDAEALPDYTSSPDLHVMSEPGRFAFLIHYTETKDVTRSDPSFSNFNEGEIVRWLEWVKTLGPGAVRKVSGVISKNGATAEGVIMSVPMLPRDMQGSGKRRAVDMIKQATDMAVQNGASRLGLGAYTSIVTRGGESVTRRGVPVTSGNTLTTVCAVEAIRRVSQRCGINLATAHAAIIGATGAIGRLASLMLAREVGKITLIGNAGNPFAPRLVDKVQEDVRQVVEGLEADRIAVEGVFQPPLPIITLDGQISLEGTTDINAAREADIVLCATSSEITLVDPCNLKPGTLVCDVARPPNVRHAPSSKTGVLVFDGGLVKPPFKIDLGPFQTLPDNLCWGCLGETLLLALARETRDFSIGSRLSLDDADKIAIMMKEHGFEPADAQWYGQHVHETAFREFRNIRSSNARMLAAV